MAETLDEQTAVTDVEGEDIFYLVRDPSGSPLDRKITGADLKSSVGGAPLYGDGSDGAITRSASAAESPFIQATTYTINSSVVMDASTAGIVVIKATESITVNGDINADGDGEEDRTDISNLAFAMQWASPGDSGTYTEGGASYMSQSGTGGGANEPEFGGYGGRGLSNALKWLIDNRPEQFDPVWPTASAGGRGVRGTTYQVGGGGGGAYEHGGIGTVEQDAANISGNPGHAGGTIVLIAPTITLGASSQLLAGGQNAGVHHGGGGGGFIILIYESLTDSGVTTDIGGGNGNDTGGNGGNGRYVTRDVS